MVEFERILCPVDLTPESEEALRYAVALARVYGARLMLCHCGGSSTIAAAERKKGCSAAVRQCVALFEEAVVRHAGMTHLSRLDWECFLLDDGDPGPLIAREAAARRADLIVMRSRRRRHAAALLGSTAEAVCRTAPCSVLVTHPRQREWVGLSAGDVCLERVLVAHDFSDSSEIALQHGASLAARFGAELHLLHVLRTPEPEVFELAWAAGATQSCYHKAVRRLQCAVPVEFDLRGRVEPTVRTGRPYEEILACAAEREVDLICMGGDGVDRGLHALFGSNVDRVLRQSPCPVLVARPFKPAVAETPEGVMDGHQGR
jgi:nucleotide-binding universal stress UspA family protein